MAEAATAVPPKVETPAAFSTEQKQELEKIIKNYLVANPEVFLEAQTALEAKMEKEQAEKLKVAIAENAAEIYRDADRRRCRQPRRRHHRRRVLRLQLRLLQARPARRHQARRDRPQGARRLQGVADPVEGLGGGFTRRLAAGKQGKYWDMHKAMLEAKGQMNEAAAMQVATKLGLDMTS